MSNLKLLEKLFERFDEWVAWCVVIGKEFDENMKKESRKKISDLDTETDRLYPTVTQKTLLASAVAGTCTMTNNT